MKAAIFNRDGDLVSVVDIPPWFVERLRRGEPMRLAERPRAPVLADLDEPVTMSGMRTVTLRALNRSCTALECDDDETALLVEAAFAPGQTYELRKRERNAEGRGAAMLWNALGQLGMLRRGGP